MHCKAISNKHNSPGADLQESWSACPSADQPSVRGPSPAAVQEQLMQRRGTVWSFRAATQADQHPWTPREAKACCAPCCGPVVKAGVGSRRSSSIVPLRKLHKRRASEKLVGAHPDDMHSMHGQTTLGPRAAQGHEGPLLALSAPMQVPRATTAAAALTLCMPSVSGPGCLML